jgi:hypothetical protein
LAAYSLRLGLTYWAAQHVYPVPYEYFRGGLALASAVALYLASTFVRLPVIPSIIANLCLMGIFGLAILLLLQPGERVMVRQIGFSAAQKLKSAFRHQA